MGLTFLDNILWQLQTSQGIFILALTVLIFAIPGLFKRYFLYKIQVDSAFSEQQRDPYFDFIKGISIIAVLIIHISHFYLVNSNYFDLSSGYILINSFLNNLARFAIPVFFICSGILLRPLDEGKQGAKKYLEFYYKKLARIFIPYILFCVVVYYVLPKYFLPDAYYPDVQTLAYRIISGDLDVPFYFIAVLLQFYLLFPLISKISRSRAFLIFTLFFSITCFLIHAK